tara:strand:- start:102 stop:272 length:171 start_codon:yes stop_codon:yes gene_type:complete
MFQRRHYTKIAEVLAETKPDSTTLEYLIQMFEKDNPNFNRGRFLKACEVENDEVAG